MAARRQIRVGRKAGSKCPSFPGFLNVLCLTPSTPYGDIGPYGLKDGKGRIMENLYQGAKVYQRTPDVKLRYSQWDATIIWERNAETHVISECDLPDDFDELGYVELTNKVPGIEGAAFLTPEYFQWRKDLMECPYPVRYPVGMKHRKECIGIIPEEQLSSGIMPMLSYIEGRKQVYVPIYQSLVLGAPKFKKLLDLYKNKDILIIEVDGPHQESLDYYKLKYGVGDDFIVGDTILCTPKNLEIMLNDSKHPYGHGYALADLILKST